MTDEIQCPKCGEPGLHPKGTCKCGYVPGSESVEMYDLRHQLAQSQAREREAVEARENAFVAARRLKRRKTRQSKIGTTPFASETRPSRGRR